jgi:phosphate transport system substrate-binding protein
MFGRTRRLRSAVVLAWAVGLVSGGCSCNTNRINGGGSTFIDPIMQKWSDVYNETTHVEIDYKKSGSGDGIQQMLVKTIDFGCTDAPMNREQTQAACEEGGEVIHIPLAMGAVVLVYNLPGINEQIVLDGKTIARIYLGEIKTWNDEAIAALNAGLREKLPDAPIVPVYRAESSGTTKVFTEYLSKSHAGFAEQIGISSEPKWPQIGTGQNGNDGIAGFVKRESNVGSIGYVEIYHAQCNNIPFARIRNRNGAAVSPDDDSVAAAAEGAMAVPPANEPYSLHDLTFSLTDVDNAKAYPLCGLSYAVFYKNQPPGKGKTIVDFLKWATDDGQRFTRDLGYAPLPESLRKTIRSRLELLQFP